MDIDKLYEEYNRVIEELGKMKLDDPNRRSLLEESEMLSKQIGEYERRDQDRVNNNARNDIAEENVRVDYAKVKSENIKNGLGFGTKVLGIGAGVFGMWYSYHQENDNFKLACKSAWSFVKDLLRIG